jgi:thiol-disulfide isomerase/thioredoxin
MDADWKKSAKAASLRRARALLAGVCLLAGCGRAAPPLIPAGGADLLRLVREPGASAVLVNVWATWCVPCREEFPDLLRLRRDYAARGLRLVLVSGDFDSEIRSARRFLEEQGVDFPTYVKTGRDMEFINAFEPKWSGVLPATFLYDAGGSLRRMWEQKTSYATLEAGVLEVLNQPVGSPARPADEPDPPAGRPAKEDAS